MKKKPDAPATHLAPSLRAVPFLRRGVETPPTALTPRQREELARIGMRVRLPPRMTVYKEGAPADWVFAVADGAAKAYRELPSGKRTVGAFVFKGDLFGLAENGRYTSTVQTITRVTLYRLPIAELTVLLRHDPDLQFQFLVKVTHELRESQRRAILVNRRDAAGRLAMFISLMQKDGLGDAGEPEVPLPMTRSDIAAFLGLSLESVSRAAAQLERRGIVRFDDRHLARVLDRGRLAKLSAAV